MVFYSDLVLMEYNFCCTLTYDFCSILLCNSVKWSPGAHTEVGKGSAYLRNFTCDTLNLFISIYPGLMKYPVIITTESTMIIGVNFGLMQCFIAAAEE